MSADVAPMVIDLAHEAGFALGGLEVRPSTRELVAGGLPELLEPRVMQVLVALARQRGQVVSRDDLVDACWGGRAVSEDAINRCISAIRRLSKVHGEFSVETITRVGYRLSETAESARASPALPSKPSIAVMPFANLSDDPEQEYFADGMMVEVTNALSRIKSIFVIASGSALTFKGAAASPQSVSRQLGVRFLLEGSVRKAGGRVRIAVQLIDAIDAVQVWASQFEDALGDVFDLQDRVALEVAGRIEPTVRQAEIRRASKGPTEHIGCYDLYLRALPALSSAERVELLQARDLLDSAIALDPDYGVALSSAALCRFLIVNFGWSRDEQGDRRRCVELAHAAIRAAGDNGEVLTQVINIVAFLENDFNAALRLADRALELNPGSPEAWAASGVLRLDPEIAIQHLERSMRLDPIGPNRIAQLLGMGRAHFLAKRFSEAVSYLRDLTRQADSNPGAFFMLAAACGQLRETHAAREALDRFKTLTPLSPAEFTQLWTAGIPPEFVKLYLDGIALAEGKADGSPET